MEKYIPKVYRSLMQIFQHLGTEKEHETTKEQYSLIDGISVDFGIMQKTRKAYVLKCEFVWDGIGTFAALGRFLANCRGNSISGITFMVQSENCTIVGRDKPIIDFDKIICYIM